VPTVLLDVSGTASVGDDGASTFQGLVVFQGQVGLDPVSHPSTLTRRDVPQRQVCVNCF